MRSDPTAGHLLSATPSRSFWRIQRWPIVVLVIGVSLSIGVAVLVDRRQEDSLRKQLEGRGGEIVAALEKGLYAPLEVLAYVPPFFESSEYVSPSEFSHFASPALARQPSIAAVEWAPRVRGDGRAEFEERIRARYWPDYRIHRLAADGVAEEMPPRDEHFPLLYRLPSLPQVRGLDIYQHAGQRRAIDLAVLTDQLTVSSQFGLVDGLGAKRAVAVFAPVYESDARLDSPEARREALAGVATAILRLETLVEDALRGINLGLLDLSIVDLSAEDPSSVLYPSKELAAVMASRGELLRPSEVFWSKQIQFQNRTWLASLSGPPMLVENDALAFQALSLGLLLSVALAGGLGAITSIARLRDQVRAARQLGQYTLEKLIGKGGMGTVYLARHSMLRRPTAVKVITADVVSERALGRFEREVRHTSELAHPNTIAIYDYGRTASGIFYYAMEFLEGLSLEQLVQECGPQPAARVLRILKQASGALAEAHDKGLIHRDIKPANLMLCERGGISDMLKVLDFGLVKQMEGDADPELSGVHAVLGTPMYMSPEAVSAVESVGPPTDVYALSAVGYYLLTGETVFTGKSVVEVCSKHLSETPVAPRERLAGCSSEALDRVLLRGLEKSLRDRPASGAELLELLEQVNDIAEEFTQSDARDWWATTGRPIVAKIEDEHTTIRTSASGHTLNVDLARREAD